MNNKKYIHLAITIIGVFLVIKCINNYSLLIESWKGLLKITMPFIMGVLLAYALNPIMVFFEKKFKLHRGLSILLSISLALTTLACFILFITPILLENIIELCSQIPGYIQQLETFFTENLDEFNNLLNTDLGLIVTNQIHNLGPTMIEIGKNVVSQILSTTISLTNLIINSVVMLVICIYTLIDKEQFIAYFKRLNKIILKKKEHITIDFIKNCNEIIGTYIIAKTLDSLFIGVVATIFLIAINSKYAVLMGVIIGITNMIPFFGPFIGGIPTVLVNIFYNPTIAILTAIFIIIIQQVDGNIISPKFVGGKVGINPFVTLFSVTVGGAYFGVLGMVLAMPFMGVLTIYLNKWINYAETKQSNV